MSNLAVTRNKLPAWFGFAAVGSLLFALAAHPETIADNSAAAKESGECAATAKNAGTKNKTDRNSQPEVVRSDFADLKTAKLATSK